MPSKMIYVSTEDLPLYERAQVLSGGNLSATVTEALRSYIEMKEEHEAGYEAITVPVGKGARRRQRFYGVLHLRATGAGLVGSEDVGRPLLG